MTPEELKLFWNVLWLKIGMWLFGLPALCRWMKCELGMRKQSRSFSFKQEYTLAERIVWGHLLLIAMLLCSYHWGQKVSFPHVSLFWIVLPNMYDIKNTFFHHYFLRMKADMKVISDTSPVANLSHLHYILTAQVAKHWSAQDDNIQK